MGADDDNDQQEQEFEFDPARRIDGNKKADGEKGRNRPNREGR